jgi:hypothetical protein
LKTQHRRRRLLEIFGSILEDSASTTTTFGNIWKRF